MSVETFEQQRGLGNLFQLLRFLRFHEVSKVLVQKVIDTVYEEDAG